MRLHKQKFKKKAFNRGILHLTATTAGVAETVTIYSITPSGCSLEIMWGDGSSTVVADGDETSKAHVYTNAGTYNIRVTRARRITRIDLRDAKLSGFNSRDLRQSKIEKFRCSSLGSATPNTVDSADMIAWPLQDTFYLALMSTGTYNIASSDMIAWRPSYWRLSQMPAGTYNIASSDTADWLPTYWYLYGMSTGTYNIATSDMTAWRPSYWITYDLFAGTQTFAASCMRNWADVRFIFTQDLSLTQATVDTILADVYAGRAGYTYATPKFNIGGTNAAPSGLLQANCPTAATGKEMAYHLANDPCTEGHNLWTVTITT